MWGCVVVVVYAIGVDLYIYVAIYSYSIYPHTYICMCVHAGTIWSAALEGDVSQLEAIIAYKRRLAKEGMQVCMNVCMCVCACIYL